MNTVLRDLVRIEVVHDELDDEGREVRTSTIHTEVVCTNSKMAHWVASRVFKYLQAMQQYTEGNKNKYTEEGDKPKDG